MRYIDISKLTLPAGWLVTANTALATLLTKSKRERNDFINSKQSTTWKDKKLVSALTELVNPAMEKCWYSETKISDDLDIDHFRPKGHNERLSFRTQFEEHLEKRHFEEIDTEVNMGWWFLAFEPTNFRVASPHRNQLRRNNTNERAKGKSDFFPLKKGSPVATNHYGVADEINCLLDPCNPHDVELLIFDSNGDIFKNHTDTWIECRINISIVVYHLDEAKLKNGRQQVWTNTEKYIIQPLVELVKDTSFSNEKKLQEVNKLQNHFYTDFADTKREFSAVAIDCLRHHQKKHPWLDRFLPNLTK